MLAPGSPFHVDVLVGEAKRVSAKFELKGAPGVWVESLPGERFGVRVANASSRKVQARLFLDGNKMDAARIGAGDIFDFMHARSEIKGDVEVQRPYIFTAPLVQELQDGMEARIDTPGLTAAATLGVIRVEISTGYYQQCKLTTKCEACVLRCSFIFGYRQSSVFRAEPFRSFVRCFTLCLHENLRASCFS